MAGSTTATEDLSSVLDRLAAAPAAIGDPAPYATLWAPGHDVTLYGAWGPVERGHEAVAHTFTWVASRFSGGALVPRNDVVHVDGDLAMSVGVEEGTVRMDGGEPRPMRLRVTHALRRIEGRRYLVHRHTDFPLADQRGPS